MKFVVLIKTAHFCVNGSFSWLCKGRVDWVDLLLLLKKKATLTIKNMFVYRPVTG